MLRVRLVPLAIVVLAVYAPGAMKSASGQGSILLTPEARLAESSGTFDPPPAAREPAPAAIRSPESQPGASRQPSREEAALLQALATNPTTAPYVFQTAPIHGRISLVGRVGTKAIHDAAIQTALALGISIRDDIVIDTAAAHMAAATAPGAANSVGGSAIAPYIDYGLYGVYRDYGGLPYVYPQPLFGKIDYPFYGMVPPLVSFPPWWRALSARRFDPRYSPIDPAALQASIPGPAPVQNASPSTTASVDPNTTIEVPPGKDGAVEMTIDPLGYAVLRGFVPSVEARIAVGQRVAQMNGVNGVLNLLEVREPSSAEAVPPPEPADINPDKSEAAVAKPRPEPKEQEPQEKEERDPISIEVDQDGPKPRLERALARRSALADLPIQVSVVDHTATLEGRVPTAYEAMLAFRTAQQMPGIDRVEDHLEFAVPEIEGDNPLVDKGRPEDVEPYMLAQLRRQLGDQAHVDRVRVQGDELKVYGTVHSKDDRLRVEAILRSFPLLRGFHVDAEFLPE